MSNLRPLPLTELIAQLTRLHAAHGEALVWLDRETRGWVARAALDGDDDITLYGNTAVDSR